MGKKVARTALLLAVTTLTLAPFGGTGKEREHGVIRVSVQAVTSCDVNVEPLIFNRNLRLRERHDDEDESGVGEKDGDRGNEVRDRGFGRRRAGGSNPHQTGTSNFNWRIRVRCNRHQVYHLAADGGDHLSGGVRHITNGRGSLVAYRLFKRGRSGEEWGDRGFGSTYPSGTSISGRGNGRWKTHMVHGRLIRPPRIPGGMFTDEVRVSIHN